MSETQAVTLQRILDELHAEDANTRLGALHELGTLTYSSPALLRMLEQLAVHDAMPAVRKTALDLIANSTHRYVQSRVSSTSRPYRDAILREINAWQEGGLLDDERAEVLRRRYDFDIAPAKAAVAPQPPPAAESSATAAATARPPEPAQPQLSLTQRLLSQSTVNVFLYLGSFLVIGAALILAALVQAARLPILASVAAVFAVSAVALKRRLPQPSFALFIVFSFLLPILAQVFGESLDLSGKNVFAYWSAVLFLTALIWAFSTWFYSSRLFSLVAFVSLVSSFTLFPGAFTSSLDWALFGSGVALLVTLAGVALLKGWKGVKFAVPTFAAAQVVELAILFGSLVSVVLHVISPSDVANGDWLGAALTWLLAALFYAASDLLFTSPLLRWAAVLALLPVPWLIPQSLQGHGLAFTASFWSAGAIYAVISEPLARLPGIRSKSYSLALIFSSVPLLAAAALFGASDSVTQAFWALAGAAVVYVVLQVLRPRGPLWATALVFGLIAYITFFTLPFMQRASINWDYQLLAAALLLLLPELFMRYPGGPSRAWRAPLIVLGILVAGVNLFSQFPVSDAPHIGSLCFAVYAVLLVAYGLHFHRPLLGYVATTFAATAVLFWLWPVTGSTWLPVFTGISVLYFAAGVALRNMQRTRSWSDPLVISGLALGALVAAMALVLFTKAATPYMIVIAAMFFAETYLRPADRLEAGGPLFVSIAALLGMPHDTPGDLGWLLLVSSLCWLIADAVYHRTLARRTLAALTRLVGAALVVATVVELLLLVPDARQVAVCMVLYALFFAADAALYRMALLGYPAAAFLALSVFFSLRAAGQHNWLYGIVMLAILYYAAGYWLRRRGETQGWSRMLLYSGLALGTLNSLSAPLQTGLEAAIPVALAATLFAVEAFATSNVWLGFPANILYLGAYFLILVWLKVDEPQFYSVGGAVLGMLMHYLLTHAGSKTGAFITGMLSQLALLGTTYIQMYSTQRLGFFFVIFFQALAVLAYGIVIRSRSLVITPIIFIVLSVFTVVYSALRGLSTVILIGGTGIILLLLGILAVLLRERLVRLGDYWSSWSA